MWCFRKPSRHTQTHTHTPSDAQTCPQLGLHNFSAHITIFHIVTHTHPPVNISDNVLFLPHINTSTIIILVCFMPLLCSLSQILQYLCVQQYFNKEYQNRYMRDVVSVFVIKNCTIHLHLKYFIACLYNQENNTNVYISVGFYYIKITFFND